MSLVFIESLDIQLSGKEILTDINLNIEKGGMTFLIGKTGSGKTTLIKSFYGDISINSSERFEIAGFNLKEIRDYQIPFLRRKIGIVFQDPMIYLNPTATIGSQIEESLNKNKN